MTQSIRVFISYARRDGESFADQLIERLHNDVPDIEILKDRNFMEGGKDYWEKIVKNIKKTNFTILVMTPVFLNLNAAEKNGTTHVTKGNVSFQ